jgi:hypothetical protein
MQLTNDGTLMLLHAKTLFCRRDGGDVPAHGGANVADATGSALILGNRGPVKVVNFQLHLEDRGTAMRPEGGSSDFYALRLSDDADNELYLDANYFATGGVELTPTDVPSH